MFWIVTTDMRTVEDGERAFMNLEHGNIGKKPTLFIRNAAKFALDGRSNICLKKECPDIPETRQDDERNQDQNPCKERRKKKRTLHVFQVNALFIV